MEDMVDTVDMVDMDTMERDLLKLMLSQATFPEDMVIEVMEDMDMAVVTMARGRLKLSQDILEGMVVMVMDVDMEAMDMDMDIMARGRLKLSQDILEGMVVMVMDVDMEVMDMDVA